jgi:hypothetical protein
MSVHQQLGVDVIRQSLSHTLGLLACEPSYRTERMVTPGGWVGSGFIAPDGFDAGLMYRQSHERWLDP